MQDISTSFMFICLLHLANEQGLKIASTTPGLVVEDDDDGSGPPDVQQEQVGNIWDLQVSAHSPGVVCTHSVVL